MLGVFQPTFGFVLEQIRLQGFIFSWVVKRAKSPEKQVGRFLLPVLTFFPICVNNYRIL